MSLLINIPDRPLDKLIAKLAEHIPLAEIQVWPEVKQPELVEFALVWKHQHGSLSQFPNLKGVSSFGAGVDSIVTDPQLPNVPVARIVDDNLAKDMANYILAMIQHHKLRLNQFANQQSQSLWKPKSARRGKQVGILGFGQLGQAAALLLSQMGYQVEAWGRSNRKVGEVTCASGEQAFERIVSSSDYLVCLLPLTKETENILDRRVFALMPTDSALINVARGKHLVEQDLLDALEQQQLAFAYLDVFIQEPLPKQHAFWQHPNIQVTPHISAVTNVDTAVSQIVENYYRVKQQQPMLHCIDLKQGY